VSLGGTSWENIPRQPGAINENSVEIEMLASEWPIESIPTLLLIPIALCVLTVLNHLASLEVPLECAAPFNLAVVQEIVERLPLPSSLVAVGLGVVILAKPFDSTHQSN
jgi:hypothetical protein